LLVIQNLKLIKDEVHTFYDPFRRFGFHG